MTRAAQLARQLDLFALITPPPPAAAPIDDRRREDWETFRARQEAAIGAGQVETLHWGKPDRTRGPSFYLDLWHDGPGWRVRTSIAMGMGGSWGQFSHTLFPTREAAMIAAFRGQLRSTARALATRSDDKVRQREMPRLAAWCIAQNDPLMTGVDLQREYDDMIEQESAREARRGAALSAVGDLARRATQLLRDAGVSAYSGAWDGGLIMDADQPMSGGAGADPEGHARKWPAEWSVSGNAPGAIGITLSLRKGQADSPAVATAKAALDALAVPVIIDDREADGRPYHPLPRWTWDQ